jgi:hypothetical protein
MGGMKSEPTMVLSTVLSFQDLYLVNVTRYCRVGSHLLSFKRPRRGVTLTNPYPGPNRDRILLKKETTRKLISCGDLCSLWTTYLHKNGGHASVALCALAREPSGVRNIGYLFVDSMQAVCLCSITLFFLAFKNRLLVRAVPILMHKIRHRNVCVKVDE